MKVYFVLPEIDVVCMSLIIKACSVLRQALIIFSDCLVEIYLVAICKCKVLKVKAYSKMEKAYWEKI